MRYLLVPKVDDLAASLALESTLEFDLHAASGAR